MDLQLIRQRFTSVVPPIQQTITATATGTVTAVSSESWATVSVAAKVVTVKVTANSGTEARRAIVTITADGKNAQVEVLQIPA